MNKILVFGAAGFIGNALVRELLSLGKEVIAVVPSAKINVRAKSRMVDLNIRVIECDLQEVKGNLKDLVNCKIDTCYFLAWDGLSNECLNNYEIQINNITYMLDLINEVKELGCTKFIGSGSITQQELFTEEGRNYLTDKHKYYRSAQQACEEMGRCLANELNMMFIWPLITNVYGEGEKSPRFINTMIRNLLNGENVATSVGKQLYDFIHIDDAVQAFVKLGMHGISGRKYIIGSGKATPLCEFLKVVETIVGSSGRIEYGKLNYSGVYYSKEDYDISNLQIDTGYKPEVSFKDGINRTLDWIKLDRNEDGKNREDI